MLIGNGDGTFDPAVPHAIGAGTAGVAIGDLDDDGKNDIVVSKGNGAGVFRGNGNGPSSRDRQPRRRRFESTSTSPT